MSLFICQIIENTEHVCNIIGYNLKNSVIFLKTIFEFMFDIKHFYFSVGWASWQNVQGFGEPPTPKTQILNLIKSIRTVMKGKQF